MPISYSDKTVLSSVSNQSKMCISLRYTSADYDWTIKFRMHKIELLQMFISLGVYKRKCDFPAKSSVFTVVSK